MTLPRSGPLGPLTLVMTNWIDPTGPPLHAAISRGFLAAVTAHNGALIGAAAAISRALRRCNLFGPHEEAPLTLTPCSKRCP
jgi:hypothetical protein